MLGGDPDMTLFFSDDGLTEDSNLVEDISDPSDASQDNSESESDREFIANTQLPSEPRTTRTGREIKKPARFRD